nr:TIGR02679 domain-containing protein [Arachnia propionica]
MSVPGYLLAWARLPGPARLLAEVRRRRERGWRGDRGEVSLDWSPSERRDIGRFLNADWRESGRGVRAAELRQGLRAHGAGLDELLVALGGPLRDLRGERAEAEQARESDRAAGLALLRGAVGDWGDDLTAVARGILQPAPSWALLAGEVADVLAATGEEPRRLAELAAALFRDPHALDRSTPLGRACVRSLELRRAVTEGGSYRDPLEDAQLWSAAWVGAGVICDAVSAQVLVLNLPLTGNAPAVRLCHAAPGEPVWLTLRSFRGDWGIAGGAEVFVCENPTVLEAAADRHGAASRPLVCTFGLPSQAAWELLTGLGEVRCHVRADGDVVGWRIVNQLRDRLPGALTWRMPEGCTAYEEELLEDLLSDLKGDTLGP